MAKKRKATKTKKPNAAQKAAVGAKLLKAHQDKDNTTKAPEEAKTAPQANSSYNPPASYQRTLQKHTTRPTATNQTGPSNTSPSTGQSTQVLMSFRVDSQLRDTFNRCCKEQDVTGSQLLRRHMKEVIEEHQGN